ncbi:MAG: hypothetical protein EGS62_13650 [Ruminococcus sp.]|nr:hypothetical protein [Ruminococcus sp.]
MPERIPVLQTGYVHVFMNTCYSSVCEKKPAGQIFCMKKPTQIVKEPDLCSRSDQHQIIS